MVKSNPENNRSRFIIDIVPIIISLIALIISFYAIKQTIDYRSSEPSITVYAPTGYSILRGLFSFPSDHLVIPIEWENSGGKNAIIRYPHIKLQNVKTGNNLEFQLAGEVSGISTQDFRDKYGYKLKNSFILDPHSISLKVLVFHISNWWDENNDNYNFKFKSGDCYKVLIEYQVNQEPTTNFSLTEIPIFGSADNLDAKTDYWWDYWPLHEVQCNK
jgi:hypothetical protein